MSEANYSVRDRAVGAVSRFLQQRVPVAGRNTFLEGPFAPVAQEVEHTALQVEGEIPQELRGVYARIGPNPIQAVNPATYHWFVGDGMVHGLRLEQGQARWYRNRWIGSDTVRDAQGLPHTPGPRRRADVVNTNVFSHGGQMWACVESGILPVELSSELDTLRYGYFNDKQDLPFSAHPHRDPHTGALHAVCYDALDTKHLQHVVIDRHGKVDRVVAIDVADGPMVHDCAITRTRVVVLDLPITFTLKEVMRGASFPYTWNPKHTARVGLLPKHGSSGDIRWCEVDPCFVFHTCNAFDNADGTVTLDVVVHERMFDLDHTGPEMDGHPVHFERWTVDPQQGRVRRQCLDSRPQEFPRFDERLTGEPYRYAYTVSFDVNEGGLNAVNAYDLHTGEKTTRELEAGQLPSEAVFVPRHARSAENDGWLMFLATSAQRSALYILRADAIDGPPQAVVHIPTRIPLGFHGNWMPDA